MKKILWGLFIASTLVMSACPETETIYRPKPPYLQTSTTALNYKVQDVGTRSTLRLTLTNKGDRTLQVSRVLVANSLPYIFGIVGDTTFNIHPDKSYVMEVYFWPDQPMGYTGSLKIFSDADNYPKGPALVELVGEADKVCGDCNTPPQPICMPSGNLLTFLEDGICDNDECLYTAVLEECADYCEEELPEPACANAPEGPADSGINGTVSTTPDAGGNIEPETTDAGNNESTTSDAGEEAEVILDSGMPEDPCNGLDQDHDEICNDVDNCPGVPNANQADDDSDGVGNDCDLCEGYNDNQDNDSDGRPNNCDNCIDDANSDQADTDTDGVGDVCDQCPGSDDAIDPDTDGIPTGCDNCPDTNGTDQTDSDSDGVGDLCEQCPGFDDTNDSDGDDIPDDCDLCPDLPEGEGVDTNDDNIDDQCVPGTCYPSISNWAPEDVVSAARFNRMEIKPDTNGSDGIDSSLWVVEDSVTGLTWQGCLYGLTGADCDSGAAVENAYLSHATLSAGNPYGDETEPYLHWRLPTIQELMSLVNFGVNSIVPWVHAFPELTGEVWSNTGYFDNWITGPYFFVVDFSYGVNRAQTYYESQDYSQSGLYVRGGNTQDRCFEVNQNENSEHTVTDTLANLMWQRGVWGWGTDDWVYQSGTAHDFPVSNSPCDQNFASLSDWRLPTIVEIQSLIYTEREDHDKPFWPEPTFHDFVNFDMSAQYTWSSSAGGFVEDLANDRWVFDFSYGNNIYLDTNTSSYNWGWVRCVRDLN